MASNKNNVLQTLSRSNTPAMIANATIQVSKSLVRFAKGEINSLELMEELGEKGTGALASSFGATIGTLVFPGVGTVIGGMVGYMTSSTLYNACMQVLKEERLSYERRIQIEAFAAAAMEAMTLQGDELLSLIKQFYEERYKVFQDSLSMLKQASEINNLDQFTEGLNQIVIEMGRALQFKNFDDFNEFMLDPDTIFQF